VWGKGTQFIYIINTLVDHNLPTPLKIMLEFLPLLEAVDVGASRGRVESDQGDEGVYGCVTPTVGCPARLVVSDEKPFR
jgi:hypothetical protein